MKLKEQAQNIETFSDAWDVVTKLYESKDRCIVEPVQKENGWIANVIKETVQMKGKEIAYKRSFVLKEAGENATEAMKNACVSYFERKK